MAWDGREVFGGDRGQHTDRSQLRLDVGGQASNDASGRSLSLLNLGDSSSVGSRGGENGEEGAGNGQDGDEGFHIEEYGWVAIVYGLLGYEQL